MKTEEAKAKAHRIHSGILNLNKPFKDCGAGAHTFVEVDDKQKLTRSFVNNLIPNLDFSLVLL